MWDLLLVRLIYKLTNGTTKRQQNSQFDQKIKKTSTEQINNSLLSIGNLAKINFLVTRSSVDLTLKVFVIMHSKNEKTTNIKFR